MKNTIKQIRDELVRQATMNIDYAVEEIDIDSLLKKKLSKKEVEKAVSEELHRKLADLIQEKLYEKLRKANVILDSWAAQKVQEFLDSMGIVK